MLVQAIRSTSHQGKALRSSSLKCLGTRQWFSSSSGNGTETTTKKPNLISREEGVHQTMQLSKAWRNKPLFRRQGDVRFKTGLEAANLLVAEANRRDSHEQQFIDSVTSTLHCLAPVFDRSPRYAFLAKQLQEPERFIQFRVAWIDDMGVVRMNRGYRIQYSSSMGPYEGSLHFGHHVNAGVIKSLGFDAVFSNAVAGFHMGAAVGGADINPFDKSEAEMQRFCQSYMTELFKYIGPDVDEPSMGMGVGEAEVGYLFGQYKRINTKAGSGGKQFLYGGNAAQHVHAPGNGVVHFANEMLQDRNDTLEGKRCLIIGSGKVARTVASKLLDFGAIPISFSDSSGFVYEPDGFDVTKLRTINGIKAERGARLGRYIINSTSAQFNEPESIFDIPCDLCFPCGAMDEVDEAAVQSLGDNGCMGVIEGGHSAVSRAARQILKKRTMLYGPHTVTLTGNAISNALGPNATDADLAAEVSRIYKDVKMTAQEFNARGDLFAGASICGFLRVANALASHGAV